MATLTELQIRLTDINSKIDKAENAQKYQRGDNLVERGLLSQLYAERDRIEDKISGFKANGSVKKACYGVSFG
jgi:hypothetical protein